MNYLHWDGWAGPADTIVVTLDRAANIQIMDDSNFAGYRGGGSFRYYGGHQRSSPVVLRPPHYGHWNLTVDLGGCTGVVHAGIRVIRNAA